MCDTLIETKPKDGPKKKIRRGRRRLCKVCKAKFLEKRPDGKYCSPKCKQKAKEERRNKRKRKETIKKRKELLALKKKNKVKKPPTKRWDRWCRVCHRRFKVKKPDIHLCSPECRKKWPKVKDKLRRKKDPVYNQKCKDKKKRRRDRDKFLQLSKYVNCPYCGRLYYIEYGDSGLCSTSCYKGYWKLQEIIEQLKVKNE